MTPCSVLRAGGAVDAEPELSRAAFSKTGAELVVIFDAMTDQAAISVGFRFPCDDVLSFSGADVSTCYWIDGFELNAEVSDALDFVPGSNVTLVSGTIKRDCDPGIERCDCDRYANASVASAAPPDPQLVPEALLEGPTTAASCEGLAVGSSQSTGSGGRPMVYAWNATAILREDWAASANASNAMAAMRSTLASVIDAANMGTGNPSFLASSEDLVVIANGGLHSLEMTLILTNFLGGASAPSAPFRVQVRTDTPPNLEIVGGTFVSMTRPTALSVRANALATSCDGRISADRAVNIQWLLSRLLDDGSLLVTDWTSTSNDPRYFKLAAYSLEAATEYELAVTATDVEAGANVTSTATISVGRAEVVAIIAGGSRVLPLAGVVALSASESYDEDMNDAIGADAGLSFAWSCDDPACDAALKEATGDDLESVSLQGTDIGVGSFVFSLNATTADGRSGIAHLTYVLVDADPPAVAIESGVGARVTTSTKVILYGVALPSSLGNDVLSSRAFNTTWTVAGGALEGGAPLAYWARTDWALSGPAQDRLHTLVLAPGSLVAGALYALRLEATLQDGSVGGAASVSFFVARPPSAGKLLASPPRGFALETQFVLATHGWVTEDAPLQYAFKTRASSANATTESTLRAPTREGSLAGVVLPEGSPNVTLVVVAIDTLGGSAEATTSAAVAPTGLAGAALANLTTGLLDAAFSLGSGEGICQTVVAAAAAASGDVALTSTLVDAVGAVASGVDADAALVEQTSSSLLAAANNGSGLAESAATSALAAAGALANASAGVGITAVAAATLGDSLSSLLESSLFDAYAAPANASNASRRLAASAGADVGVTLDAVARAQLEATVPGEAPSEVTAGNLRMASQKLQTSRAGTELAPAGAATTATVSGDVAGSVAFSEFSVNQHAASTGGDAVQSTIVRFGALDDGGYAGRPANGTRGRVALALGSTAVRPSNATGGNATCPAGGGGNVTFACPDGTMLSAPCPATGVREATVITFSCPFTEAGCAFWDGSAWTAPPGCETQLDGDDVTCVCDIADGALDYGATANSVLGTYASAFTSLSAKDLLSSPLLYWTVTAMAGICLYFALIGAVLDRRDAAAASKKKQSGPAPKVDVVALDDLVAESMPTFVRKLERPVAWAGALLWKHHSWCKIMTTYAPATSRPRRCVTLFFSLLMIMFGQAIAFWFAFPVGFCDDALFQRNCEAKKTLFAELVAGLAGEEARRDACVWYDVPPVGRGGAKFCQLRPPAEADIGFKRLLLVFLGVILAIPFTELFDATFVTYVCAPLKKRPKAEETSGAPPVAEEAPTALKPLPLAHRAGLNLCHNLGVTAPALDVAELPPSSYYALRALLPAMLRICFQHEEFSEAMESAKSRRQTRDLSRLRAKLEGHWGLSGAPGLDGDGDVEWVGRFAKVVFTELAKNLEVAATYMQHVDAVKDDRKAARCLVNLMRRESLTPHEVKVFESQLTADGAFAGPKPPPKTLPPVSLEAKVVASVLCLGAFAGPIFFLMVFASAEGHKMTRCWYFSTVFFVFIAVFIVEPFTVFIMKLAVPASLYEKLRWAEDPCAVTSPFRCKLFVSPADILFAERSTPFDAVGATPLPARLLDIRAVAEAPASPDRLAPLRSRSLAKALGRKLDAAAVRTALIAETAGDFRGAYAKHLRCRDEFKRAQRKFAALGDAWSHESIREWRKATHWRPPLYYATTTLFVACVIFLNPAVRGCIIKQCMIMLSLCVVPFNEKLPLRVRDALVEINSHVPGVLPVILAWSLMVCSILAIILAIKLKFYVTLLSHPMIKELTRRMPVRALRRELSVVDDDDADGDGVLKKAGDDEDEKIAKWLLHCDFGSDAPAYDDLSVAIAAGDPADCGVARFVDAAWEGSTFDVELFLERTAAPPGDGRVSARELRNYESRRSRANPQSLSQRHGLGAATSSGELDAALVYAEPGDGDGDDAEPAAAGGGTKKPSKMYNKLLTNFKGQCSKGMGEFRKLIFPQ